MKSRVCQSTSIANTQLIAKTLAKKLVSGGTVLLNGDLGSGKTTFTQGLAQGLGITNTITSPTFTIMNVYPTHHPVITQLVHVDLYRINQTSELLHLDIEDMERDPTTLLVIEWPKKITKQWHHLLGTISFRVTELQHHEITFEGPLTTLLS